MEEHFQLLAQDRPAKSASGREVFGKSVIDTRAHRHAHTQSRDVWIFPWLWVKRSWRHSSGVEATTEATAGKREPCNPSRHAVTNTFGVTFHPVGIGSARFCPCLFAMLCFLAVSSSDAEEQCSRAHPLREHATCTRTNGKLLNSLLFSNGLRLFTHQYQILRGSLFVRRWRFGILQVHAMIDLCFGLCCAARTAIFHWHCVLSGEARSFVFRCVCFCSNFPTQLSEHTWRSYRFRRQ